MAYRLANARRCPKDPSWQTIPAGLLPTSGTAFLFGRGNKAHHGRPMPSFCNTRRPIYIAMISPRGSWVSAPIGVIGCSSSRALRSGPFLFRSTQSPAAAVGSVAAALGSGIAFAWLTVLMRRQRVGSPEAVVLLGNAFTFLIASPWMFPIRGLEQNGARLLLLVGLCS